MLSRLKMLRSSHPQLVRAQFITSSIKSASKLICRRQVVTMPPVIHQREYKYTEGKVYHGFQCERVEHISEFELTSYTLRHEGTGTELWHIDRNDANNVFSINFRTTPFDSTGLPHILEHLSLCGSKKFPVRDPFFKMLNRSVATFMNAMTGPDYTIYPFSTMNEMDFRNLQQIYLDAVFRPNLAYLDFLQEGWRLEHKDINDQNSPLVIKGVVYNEMKGAFSENAQIFGQSLLNNVFPDHTYGHVSGGNPLEIPKLTHPDLVDFHKKYYHPSNSRIYSYGLFDTNKTLALLDKEYLSKQNWIDNSYSRIPQQERWIQPRNVHISSRLDNMGATIDRQNQIAIALLMCDATNIQESFDLQVLSEVLIRGPNSAFYKNLIEPNFSGGYNQGTGYSSDTKDTAFVVGLQDLKVEDFTKFIELFDKTISKAIGDGFQSEHLESVLHNLELSLKHQSPNFGITLLLNSTALWNHEGDVVSNLRVSDMISRLRASLSQNNNYFQDKMEQYFVNNNHRLTLTMSPDELYEENFRKAEKELLRQKVKNLAKENLNQIYENGLILDAFQKAKPNNDVLPCLTLKDVIESLKWPKVFYQNIKNVQTQICKASTNDVTYCKCLFNITDLTQEETMLVPLFCNVISAMGTTKYNYRQFDELVLSKTGGIDFSVNLIEDVNDGKSYRLSVLMSTHALEKNVSSMFHLCQELLNNFMLNDLDRLKMLIENYISNISVGVASSGHLYAILGATSLVSDAGKLKDLLSGVGHINFMKNYVRITNPLEMRDKLTSIGRKVFNKSNMRGAINSTQSYMPLAIKHYENFLETLPDLKKTKTCSYIQFFDPSCQQYSMNIPVNYCAKAFFAAPYLHKDHPTLRVLAKVVSAKYLLPVVREQNGAYGAGARISSDGIFSFYSYRDPHSSKTLDAFDKTYKWLRSDKSVIDQQSLFEAKLGVLQQLDSTIAPGNIGIDNLLYELSQECFEDYRSRMLSVTINDFQDCIEKYFRNPSKYYGKCILGPVNNKLEFETGQKWKINN
ncbi:presequence protease, mitochondrial [Drosophila takahashii]|uniref:presequence protease, mitochondrial n=1 Tax=Drosophila takahashii TaxID=29030 RepID=UPI0007E6BFB0